MISAGFKFADEVDPKQSAGPNTVLNVDPLEPYLVRYVDGESREQVRIAFRLQGSDTSFMIQEKIQGKSVVIPTHPWFHKAFVTKVREKGFEKGAPGADQV